MTRLALPALGTLAASLVAAGPAQAHGLVGKQDLPIPRWLFAWAAFVVLVISFVALATLWQQPRFGAVRERRRLTLPGLLDPLCGTLGVLMFAGLVYAGLSGTQESAANLLPTVVYVAFWIGIPIASLFLGDVFRAFNPWRAVGRAVGAMTARVGGDAQPEPLAYPERLGRWPAVAGILLFAALELTYASRDDPSTLAILALLYAAVQLVGMSLFGVRAWSEKADAFGVYFGLFATLSPLRWTREALYTRAPLSGTAQLAPGAGLVALVCVMIGSTSFDGFSAGSFWTSIAGDVQPRLVDAGLSIEHATELTFLAGLLVMIGIVTTLYLLGCRGMRSAVPRDTGESTMDLARRFAPTLVPIALAYVVAHYFGLLSYQGQAMTYLLSDPLGRGHDYLGLAHTSIDYTWISATGIWYVQVAALVLGHAVGLALAHDRALLLFPQPRVAARSQYWMLAVMVTFTSLALWLLSNTN
jgi:hypothetical protein